MIYFVKYFSYGIFELVLFNTYTIFNVLSNETKLSLVAAIVLEIFILNILKKNLEIAVTPEILITQYLMTSHLLYSFRHALKLLFFDLASCHSLASITLKTL